MEKNKHEWLVAELNDHDKSYVIPDISVWLSFDDCTMMEMQAYFDTIGPYISAVRIVGDVKMNFHSRCFAFPPCMKTGLRALTLQSCPENIIRSIFTPSTLPQLEHLRIVLEHQQVEAGLTALQHALPQLTQSLQSLAIKITREHDVTSLIAISRFLQSITVLKFCATNTNLQSFHFHTRDSLPNDLVDDLIFAVSSCQELQYLTIERDNAVPQTEYRIFSSIATRKICDCLKNPSCKWLQVDIDDLTEAAMIDIIHALRWNNRIEYFSMPYTSREMIAALDGLIGSSSRLLSFQPEAAILPQRLKDFFRRNEQLVTSHHVHWRAVCFLLSFMRANGMHTFRDSILAIITSMAPSVSSSWLSRFMQTQFFSRFVIPDRMITANSGNKSFDRV